MTTGRLPLRDSQNAIRTDGQGLVETILRSPVSLRATHTENTVGPLSRDVHHLVRMAGVN